MFRKMAENFILPTKDHSKARIRKKLVKISVNYLLRPLLFILGQEMTTS